MLCEVTPVRLEDTVGQGEGDVVALIVVERENVGEAVELALRQAVALAEGQAVEEIEEDEQGDTALLRLEVTVAHAVGELDGLTDKDRVMLGEGVPLALRQPVALLVELRLGDTVVQGEGELEALAVMEGEREGLGVLEPDRHAVGLPVCDAVAQALSVAEAQLEREKEPEEQPEGEGDSVGDAVELRQRLAVAELLRATEGELLVDAKPEAVNDELGERETDKLPVPLRVTSALIEGVGPAVPELVTQGETVREPLAEGLGVREEEEHTEAVGDAEKETLIERQPLPEKEPLGVNDGDTLPLRETSKLKEGEGLGETELDAHGEGVSEPHAEGLGVEEEDGHSEAEKDAVTEALKEREPLPE
jgi:hypothetical protein